VSDRPPDDDSLIIDELGRRMAQLRLLYDDDAATDEILNDLGGQGRVERDIVRHLANTRTLAFPERFVDAHRVAMHALEVLARNGSRPPSQLSLGPLTGAVRYLAQQAIRPIVRGHQGQVVDSLRDLYTRRLGWMPADDPYRMVVIRARMDVERAAPSYKKRTSVLPTALAGGAAASSVAQIFRGGASAAFGSRGGLVVGGLVAFVLLVAVSWVVLHGAAIARRRIRLSLDRPLGALWETVGWCGRPPKDNARMFAAVAIVVTVVGWLVIPVAALLVFAVF
jgi:hypothetical protein